MKLALIILAFCGLQLLAQGLKDTGPRQLGFYTAAELATTLPPASSVAVQTDSLSTTCAGTVTGGGSTYCVVLRTASAWVYAGGSAAGATISSGTSDPPAGCADPGSPTSTFYIQTVTNDLWTCLNGVWKIMLSTDGQGPWITTGEAGAAPSTPAAGSISWWPDSTSKTLKAIDDAAGVSTTVRGTTATTDQYLSHIDTDGVQHKVALKNRQITLVVVDVTATGVKSCSVVEVAGTIVAAHLITNAVPTGANLVVDVRKVAFASYTGTGAASSIAASAIPTITTAASNPRYEDLTLTGWTTSVAANDIVCVAINTAPTGASTWASLSLEVQ